MPTPKYLLIAVEEIEQFLNLGHLICSWTTNHKITEIIIQNRNKSSNLSLHLDGIELKDNFNCLNKLFTFLNSCPSFTKLHTKVLKIFNTLDKQKIKYSHLEGSNSDEEYDIQEDFQRLVINKIRNIRLYKNQTLILIVYI